MVGKKIKTNELYTKHGKIKQIRREEEVCAQFNELRELGRFL